MARWNEPNGAIKVDGWELHYLEDGEDRCGHCGSKYHCGKCGGASSMLGHVAHDEGGDFYTCQDPARDEALREFHAFKHQASELKEMRRLIAKYPQHAANALAGVASTTA